VVDDKDHLQTDICKFDGINPWDDPLADSHGTCTAGKALGARFGAAKQAKLVVVQIANLSVDEILNGVKLIFNDITKTHPERRKKSVVTMSVYLEQNTGDPMAEEILHDAILTLMEEDIPMFTSSGNFASDPKNPRKEVDTIPGIWEGEDYPLIVVGSTDHGGALSPFSQEGKHVFIHATGNQITCMLRQGADPAKNKEGTSFSAPVVAGEVANLLSYDTVPFDTSDKNLVKNMRKYLQKTSWARPGGVPMLWNGVTEKDNPKIEAQASSTSGPAPTTISPPPPPPKSPEKHCKGLANSQYVSRTELADIIENQFCPDVVKQGGADKDSGSIGRHYNDGTSESVSIAIDGTPGVPLKPSQDDCKKHFLEIIDGCDGNSPDNPENYKGGGTFSDGTFTYHIDPLTLRQPASEGKQGGCVGAYKALWNEYTIWGHGWDSADRGDSLKKELGGCALLPDTWDFQYGLGSDGREWTAKFRTGVFQKHCAGDAAKTASGIKDFGCSGSG
jgi:subtilisin family serine protease